MEENFKDLPWIDSYNSCWTREDISLLLHPGGTQFLHEKLISNGEIEGISQEKSSQTVQRSGTRWKVFDSPSPELKSLNSPSLLPRTVSLEFGNHFKDWMSARDFEVIISSLVDLQLKSTKKLLNQSDQVKLIRNKVLVFSRLGHAYKVIYQRRNNSQQKSPSRTNLAGSYSYLFRIFICILYLTFFTDHPNIVRGNSLSSNDGFPSEHTGTPALIELGLTTGLSLVFALLKQNWQQNQLHPGSSTLCNEVLKTASRVLSSLPVMALSSTSAAASDIGQSTLNQVNDFLVSSMDPANIGQDEEGSSLSTEVLLLLSLHRGKLSLILQWIYQAVQIGKLHPRFKIRAEIVKLAVSHIKSIASSNRESKNEDNSLIQEIGIGYEDSAKIILNEIMTRSQMAGLQGNPNPSKNEAFLWGSNSSHQLAESSNQEKVYLPRKTVIFQDVVKMEAGQYCTFVIHESGSVSAVGKGNYGRLGLGDSTNHSIPRRLSISNPVMNISSSKGSDGHTLALTEDGHVYSWGDGDYGKLGHGNPASQKSPKQILGPLSGKSVVQISAGYRYIF